MSTSTELRRIVGAMTERPWKVWTSNSFRRITAHRQQDGGVLRGEVHRDGQTDLGGNNRDADLAAIATLANHADALVKLVEAVERAVDAARRRLDADAAAERSIGDAIGTALDFTSAIAMRAFADEDGRSAMRDMEAALAAVHAVRSQP